MMELTTIWFALIAVLWIGYFVLEGFDFGVGILLFVLGRNEPERRAMLRTIGPVWDGNEVWLLVAGGAMFAAFPEWYATLFSGFYLALFLILVALIVRGIGHRVPQQARRRAWRIALGRHDRDRQLRAGAPVGRRLREHRAGVPIDADKEFTGNLFTLLNPFGLLGGLTTLLLFVTHGALFLALKTDGEIRERARPATAPGGAADGGRRGGRSCLGERPPRRQHPRRSRCWPPWPGVCAGCADTADAARAGRSSAPAVTIALAVVSLFVALFPDVMPSSTDPAYSLTITNAASTPYTLTIMTVVAVVFTPHRPGLPGVDLLGLPQAGDGPAGNPSRPDHRPRPRGRA